MTKYTVASKKMQRLYMSMLSHCLLKATYNKSHVQYLHPLIYTNKSIIMDPHQPTKSHFKILCNWVDFFWGNIEITITAMKMTIPDVHNRYSECPQ